MPFGISVFRVSKLYHSNFQLLISSFALFFAVFATSRLIMFAKFILCKASISLSLTSNFPFQLQIPPFDLILGFNFYP